MGQRQQTEAGQTDRPQAGQSWRRGQRELTATRGNREDIISSSIKVDYRFICHYQSVSINAYYAWSSYHRDRNFHPKLLVEIWTKIVSSRDCLQHYCVAEEKVQLTLVRVLHCQQFIKLKPFQLSFIRVL
ncbi:hypothetical protein RJT34_16019 [Clitoria ternatea]|uniref:Uncharacterized protein n=1 Tax=Clitoria ternatea TaxID=43366 RepID=A0AAN9J8F8_CLITE